MAGKVVQVIQATVPIVSAQSHSAIKKRRVAGYARVSTEKEEQQNSYEAQMDYYTTYIQSNPEWIFVDVYSDEGITGTNMKKRDGFNQMIADALDGKIDLIITKSVSRFARNTVDSLTTVRKLMEKGVEVYFQKENIYTLDSKGELLITIMSSLAQEESRSISENTTWGQRKRFADGKMSLAYSNFLGYKKGSEAGEMEIVEEEAVIVRRIYDEYLSGKTPYDIATRLTEEQIPTPGKKTLWRVSTTAYNDLMGNRSTVLADCELIRQTLCDTTALDAEMQQEQDEMAVVSELMQAHIKKNASVAQSQEAYALEAGRIENRYNAAFEHYTALETEKEKRMRKSKEISTFITTLKKQPLTVLEWNERLWITLLDTATVQRDGRIVFLFKSGKEIIK